MRWHSNSHTVCGEESSIVRRTGGASSLLVFTCRRDLLSETDSGLSVIDHEHGLAILVKPRNSIGRVSFLDKIQQIPLYRTDRCLKLLFQNTAALHLSAFTFSDALHTGSRKYSNISGHLL